MGITHTWWGSLRLAFWYQNGTEWGGGKHSATNPDFWYFRRKLKEDLKLNLYIKFLSAPIHKGFYLFFIFHVKRNWYLKICYLTSMMPSPRTYRIGGQWVPKGSFKVLPARSLPAFSRTAFNVNDSQRTATQPSMKAVGPLRSQAHRNLEIPAFIKQKFGLWHLPKVWT